MQVDRLVPFFRDTVGQEALITHLIESVRTSTLPHALLLEGDEGSEALPLALALARYLHCMAPTDRDACGQCLSCRQMGQLSHPDFYVIAPVVKADGGDHPITDDRLPELRELLSTTARPTLSLWKERLKSGNKQPQIYVSEADALIKKLAVKSMTSQCRVVLLWGAELMNVSCANTLLKLIEEPPAGVHFIMVSSRPKSILPTIYSRLQRISVGAISEGEVAQYLMEEYGVDSEMAGEVAHLTQGNLHQAITMLSGEDSRYYSLFARALQLLVLPIDPDPKALKMQSEELHGMPRGEVLELLDLCMAVLREALAHQYAAPEAQYVRRSNLPLLRQLAQHLPLQQVPAGMKLLMTARAEIAQNVSVKIVFFDLFLSLAKLYS